MNVNRTTLVLQRLLMSRSFESPEGGPRQLRPVLGCRHIRFLAGMHLPCSLNSFLSLGSRVSLLGASPCHPCGWPMPLFMVRVPRTLPAATLESCGLFAFSCPFWAAADETPTVAPSSPSLAEVGLIEGAAPAKVDWAGQSAQRAPSGRAWAKVQNSSEGQRAPGMPTLLPREPHLCL